MSAPERLSLSPLASRPACFKAYDVRGHVGCELNRDMARRIGQAFAAVLGPKVVVVGHDCRVSSPSLQTSVIRGLIERGVDVIDIGEAGTEEVYFATSHFGAGGGIVVTASHNPADYNGMKFVGPESRPLSGDEFDRLARLAGVPARLATGPRGRLQCRDSRGAYARRVADLVEAGDLPPLRIVTNAGHGVAGAAFDAIHAELTARGARIKVQKIAHRPDGSFPLGIPNPLLPENRTLTAQAVCDHGADLGIAWDGDFDRCFLFDHRGRFVDGEYVTGLLASAFLASEPGAGIVHDPRVIWNTRHQVAAGGGRAHMARTGHVHLKQALRDTGAVYGGEMSAHHYFRDFMCCDSGMIPWLKVIELMGRKVKSLADLVADMRARFPSSGEINFAVADPRAAVETVEQALGVTALSADRFDGLTLCFGDWRLNLRPSSTEPLLRLNIETRGVRGLLAEKIDTVTRLLSGCAGS